MSMKHAPLFLLPFVHDTRLIDFYVIGDRWTWYNANMIVFSYLMFILLHILKTSVNHHVQVYRFHIVPVNVFKPPPVLASLIQYGWEFPCTFYNSCIRGLFHHWLGAKLFNSKNVTLSIIIENPFLSIASNKKKFFLKWTKCNKCQTVSTVDHHWNHVVSTFILSSICWYLPDICRLLYGPPYACLSMPGSWFLAEHSLLPTNFHCRVSSCDDDQAHTEDAVQRKRFPGTYHSYSVLKSGPQAMFMLGCESDWTMAEVEIQGG